MRLVFQLHILLLLFIGKLRTNPTNQIGVCKIFIRDLKKDNIITSYCFTGYHCSCQLHIFGDVVKSEGKMSHHNNRFKFQVNFVTILDYFDSSFHKFNYNLSVRQSEKYTQVLKFNFLHGISNIEKIRQFNRRQPMCAIKDGISTYQ